jgi:RsiW-degrading membrane proteinase PrsW (M82 family)
VGFSSGNCYPYFLPSPNERFNIYKNNPMIKYIYNSLIAFSGGLFGVSVLFIVFYLIFDIARFESPFPPTFLGVFLFYLAYNSIVEEGTKFLLIKRNIGQFPYGFLLGLGFGVGETILQYPFWEFGTVPERRIGAIFLHIITAGIICYFIKKNKPVLGLAIAIVIHTGFNLIVHWAVR